MPHVDDTLGPHRRATIGVVGAGTMGAGIAQVFAQHGFPVLLTDSSPEALDRAQARIEASLAKLVEKRTIDDATRGRARAGLRRVPDLESLRETDVVIEAIPENREAKQGVFRQLDAIVAPDALLASNTSSMAIGTLASVVSQPDRVLGMHFMNPVPLMPLVELVRAPGTSDHTMDRARQLCAAIDKQTVVAADRPGFLTNRILMPMINEAVFALMEGVGTAEDIDAVMTLGMRHPMGPLRLADLIGLDVCLAILEELQTGLADRKYRPCPLLREKVASGHLGRKTGRGFYLYDPAALTDRQPKSDGART
jgi:3-hydroxybutyryl-CoA dehydrogenase